MFSVFTQAADDTNDTQSFNPFLVDDPVPSLLLDTNSPDNKEAQPILQVLSYFQKQSFSETESNISKNVSDNKMQDKHFVEGRKSENNQNQNANFVDSADNCDKIESNNRDNNFIASDTTKAVHKEANRKKCVPPPRPPPPARMINRSCCSLNNEDDDAIYNASCNAKLSGAKYASASNCNSLDLENSDDHIDADVSNIEQISLPKSISNLSLYNTPFTLTANEDMPVDSQAVGKLFNKYLEYFLSASVYIFTVY